MPDNIIRLDIAERIRKLEASKIVLKRRNGELLEEAEVIHKSYLIMADELKDLRVMNEQLRSKLAVTELQHNNALAKLEDNGIK